MLETLLCTFLYTLVIMCAKTTIHHTGNSLLIHLCIYEQLAPGQYEICGY